MRVRGSTHRAPASVPAVPRQSRIDERGYFAGHVAGPFRVLVDSTPMSSGLTSRTGASLCGVVAQDTRFRLVTTMSATTRALSQGFTWPILLRLMFTATKKERSSATPTLMEHPSFGVARESS